MGCNCGKKNKRAKTQMMVNRATVRPTSKKASSSKAYVNALSKVKKK